MWTLLGLLTLAGIAVYAAISRWEVDWKGDPFGAGRMKLYTDKGRTTGLRVGIATPSELDFEIKPETWIDRLAKRLGVSTETQVGSGSLDELLYFITDDTRLTGLLRQDGALAARVEGIGRANTQDFAFQRLVCRRGQLWLMLKPSGKPSGHLNATQWAMNELQALSGALPALPKYKQRTFDQKFLYVVIVFGASVGLIANALLHMVRLAIMDFPFTVDDGKLWSLAIPLALALLAVLVFATVLLLGRSARMHLLLGEVLLFGGLGALGTVFIELRDLNMEASQGPPTGYIRTITGKHVSRSRKSTSYYIEMADWNGGDREKSIRVSHSDYTRYLSGDRVVVMQWPGALGVRWVESVAPAPAR